MTELQVAKQIIINNLTTNMNKESFYAIYEIENGNKKELLEHIKVLSSIFNKAKKDLEKELKGSDKK